MLVLRQPPGAWGLPSISPFCNKLDVWLRVAGVEFTVARANPGAAPKGKMPYVELDGEVIGDSQLIIERLKSRYGVDPDAGLSPAARAQGHAVRRMLEEGTYFALVHARWVLPAPWSVYRAVFLSWMPPVIGPVIMYFVRRQVLASLRAQGTGRHQQAEIEAMAIADYSVVAELLGEKPYLLGDAPTSVDATAYAFLVGVLRFPVESAIQRYIRSQPNLVAYCDRMTNRYYPPQPG